MTEADVLGLIKREVEKAGSVASWARHVGISPSYVHDVLCGRRQAGSKVLEAVQVERSISYRRKAK